MGLAAGVRGRATIVSGRCGRCGRCGSRRRRRSGWRYGGLVFDLAYRCFVFGAGDGRGDERGLLGRARLLF